MKKPVTRTVPGKSPGPRLSKNQANKIIKAINANDIATVESELDQGMDINSTLYGGTLLMKSANLGTTDMVKMLIARGTDLNYRNRLGRGGAVRGYEQQPPLETGGTCPGGGRYCD